MKNILILFFFLCICIMGITISCKPKYENPNSDDIIGKWKLVEIRINGNIIDYSNDNIIYDFQANNKLIVSGVVIDTLSLFECFKEGEHFYEYRKPLDPPSGRNKPIPIPAPNLSIDKLDIEEKGGYYYCNAPLGKQTMSIYELEVWLDRDRRYSWTKKFVILK